MESGRDEDANLATVYDDSVTLDPDRPAFIDGETGDRVTYAEFDRRVAAAGNAAGGLGVERCDRVALLFDNDLTYLSLFFGIVRMGAVPVPVNVQSTAETIRFVIDDSGARTVVAAADPEILGVAVEAAADVESLVVASPDADAALTEADVERPDCEVLSLPRLLREADDELPPAPVAPSDPAFQAYTSGSTGKPKGVVLSHGGTSWNARAVRLAHLFEERERGLVAAPLYHKNAMAHAVKPLLAVGGTLIVMNGFDPEAVIGAIDRYGVTYTTGVPAMYRMLVDATDALEAYDVSTLEWAVCGSDTVPETLHEEFDDAFGATMLEAYGLTEGGPVVCASPRWGPQKVGSAGIPLPGVDIEVVDPESGEPLPPGETGELLVSNPGLGRYHDRPDERAEAFEERDGRRYLHTGDLVRRDEQGYLYVAGRLDEMLIVGGENLYPAEAENLLERHESVGDVAVVGVPHEVKGEAPVAFVIAEGGTSLDERSVKEFALERGPAFAHPRRVFFVEELPLTGSGKVDRRALEEEALDRIDGPL